MEKRKLNHIAYEILDYFARSILWFAIITISLWVVNFFYLLYFDHTVYYKVQQPIPLEKNIYHPGENSVLVWDQTSLVDANAITFNELVLIGEDKTAYIIPVDRFERPIFVGESMQKIYFALPQNIKPGNYYWHGNLQFNVRGVQKTYAWTSDHFSVESNTE